MALLALCCLENSLLDGLVAVVGAVKDGEALDGRVTDIGSASDVG